jgi:hypothetical protein
LCFATILPTGPAVIGVEALREDFEVQIDATSSSFAAHADLITEQGRPRASLQFSTVGDEAAHRQVAPTFVA